MNEVNVTIDFDGTLDRKDVQEIFKRLRDHPAVQFRIRVLTARYDDLHAHHYDDGTGTNQDLYDIVHHLGIQKSDVIFLNGLCRKGHYLNETSVIMHIDDSDMEELYALPQIKNQDTQWININKDGWKEEIDQIVEICIYKQLRLHPKNH